ncbi:MAG: peptidoglycan DD-metalloendopeptidase family protein [Deltaproteobacteria bacterium]|nr:peptidoglycan DD-metalloendopeptidase family protein [Deltaproteobacteria bacterium]
MSCFLKTFLIASLLAWLAAPAQAGQKPTRQELIGKEKTLEDVKRQIREERDEVRAIEKKETGILDEIEGINRSIAGNRAVIRKLEASLARIGRKIKAANGSIAGLEKERRALAARLGARLKAMYMMNRGEVMDVIFSSSTSGDLGRRHKYLTVIMDYDAGLIKRFEENLGRIEAEKEGLKGLQADLARDRAEAVRRKKEAEGLQGRKYAILKDTQREKGRREKAVTELEQAARELSDLIGRLRQEEEQKTVESGFAAMKGRLAMPVAGKVVSPYGRVTHPRFQTVTFNNGIVIEAPLGAPVKSVYGGKAVYVGWLKGYGQVVIIDHGGGFYTLFAYLSEALKQRGDDVGKGDDIGLVGDTGPRASGGLYFEIRQKGVPRDPLAWLARK